MITKCKFCNFKTSSVERMAEHIIQHFDFTNVKLKEHKVEENV